jgi:hypothetical protein
MNRLMFVLLLFGFSGEILAASDTMRCGSKIVKIGMSMEEVLKYCGEPSTKEIEEHDVRSGNRVTGTTQLHIWSYNRAASQAPTVLQFDVDKLISIKTRAK